MYSTYGLNNHLKLSIIKRLEKMSVDTQED